LRFSRFFFKSIENKKRKRQENIARSKEILGWEGVGNRQLLCFFKA
jgi:hypothetical protein